MLIIITIDMIMILRVTTILLISSIHPYTITDLLVIIHFNITYQLIPILMMINFIRKCRILL